MRKISIAAATFVALAAFCAPASAATLLLLHNGQDLSQTIHNNGGVDNNDFTLTFASKEAGLLVDYSSTVKLSYPGMSSGFAVVSSMLPGGIPILTITPSADAPVPFSFSEFKFNLDLPSGPGNGYKTDFTFDAQVFFTGGGSQTFGNVDAGDGNGNNRLDIKAGAGELINKIILSDLEGFSTKHNKPNIGPTAYNFDAIKQASFNAISSVPEPATWAEFILGFGAIGVALRRRRSQAALPA